MAEPAAGTVPDEKTHKKSFSLRGLNLQPPWRPRRAQPNVTHHGLELGMQSQ
jgi:hypothetical protein